MSLSTKPRFIVATIAFFTVLGAICYYALTLPPSHSSSSGISDTEEPPSFFYKSIGNSPPNLSDNPRGQSSKSSIETNEYTVQLAIVFSKKEADEKLKFYNKKGIDAYYTPFHNKGKVYFKVRYGITKTADDAQKIALDLQAKHNLSAKVVKL